MGDRARRTGAPLTLTLTLTLTLALTLTLTLTLTLALTSCAAHRAAWLTCATRSGC